MEHKGTKRIESENLILRRFELSDVDAIYKNWATDSDVTHFLTWKPVESIDALKNTVSEWVDDYKNNNCYQWAIIPKDNKNEPVGAITIIRQDDEVGKVQLGYCIGKQWWNKGITSESLKILIDFFIKEVNVNRIEARFDPRNINSGRVMAKCGMKYEGTMRQADKNNQGICDSSMYALLAEDYFNSDKPNNP